MLFTPHLWLPSPSGPYVGPGDLNPGWLFFCGLRAYTNASIGSNAIRLRRESDNAEADFATIAGGGFDVTAITNWINAAGAATGFFTKWYDQTGNGYDHSNANASQQWEVSVFGSRLIAVTLGFARVSSMNGIVPVQAQPCIIAAVANCTGPPAVQVIWSDNFQSAQLTHGNANQTYMNQIGAVVTNCAATDNAWHSYHALFNGNSSNLHIDTADNFLTNFASTLGLFGSSNISTIGGYAGGAGYTYDGQIVEMGVPPSSINSAGMTTQSNLARTFYGY